MESISFERAKELIDSEKAVLTDVREEEEYILGHAAGAVLLPLDTINSESAAAVIPSKATPVILYCKTGSRSSQAALMLEEIGYTRVYDIGGLVGWEYGIEYEY